MKATTFASRVKARREHLKISQTELAKRVGISQVAIKKIEGGGNTRHGRLLADALGVSLAYLETGQEQSAVAQDSATAGAGPATSATQSGWPFPSVPESLVRTLPGDQIKRLEGALLLALGQMGVRTTPDSTASRSAAATRGGVANIEHVEDPFPMRLREPMPWEGGQTTFAATDLHGLRISMAVDVGHVANAGYSANDQEFMPVPELDVRLAAGRLGIENYHETEIGELLLRRSFLQSFGLPIERMRIVYADGDSMEPVIRHCGPMLFYEDPVTDLQQIHPRTIYAINHGGKMIVKCIVHGRDGTWLARSLNPAHADFALHEQDGREVRIVGRILWSPYDLRNGVDQRLVSR
ncbi:XRE family transcriptional regulator [Achromobacter kerstersii]